MIKYQEMEDLDGIKINNIQENGIIVNYQDMEFYLMKIQDILDIFGIIINMDMELAFIMINTQYQVNGKMILQKEQLLLLL